MKSKIGIVNFPKKLHTSFLEKNSHALDNFHSSFFLIKLEDDPKNSAFYLMKGISNSFDEIEKDVDEIPAYNISFILASEEISDDITYNVVFKKVIPNVK